MKTTPLNVQPVWVSSSEIGVNRFDSLYYDPSLTIAEQCLRAKGKLKWKRLRDVFSQLYSFGAYELTNRIKFVQPSENSRPFINVTEIANPFVEFERARHIDLGSHQLLAKSVCEPGTLLLSMSGSIGRVGVVPIDAGQCNSNQHVAKIVVDPEKHDAHFLSAYFSSSIGQSACNREAAGAVQKELYLYNISTLPIPDPPKSVRQAIGHKIRAAEKLRASAGCRVRTAIAEVETQLGWPMQIDPAQNCFSSPCNLQYRIDPLPYLPRFTAVRDLMLRHGGKTLLEMGATASNGCEIRDVTPSGRPYLLVGDMEVWHLRSLAEVGRIPISSEVPDKSVPRVGDLICVRTGPVGYMASWEPAYGEAVLSSHWIRIRGSEEKGFDAGYIALVSQLPAWQILMQAIVYGAVQPQISQEEILQVPIPFIGSDLATRTSMSYRTAVSEAFRAKGLAADAISDVEQLILGRLVEAECVEEGNALAAEFALEVLK